MRLVPLSPGRYRVEGDADLLQARQLQRDVAALPPEGGVLTFELRDFDLASGPACAAVVDAFRDRAASGVKVVLISAPQALAHVLYRVGALPSIELVDPRVEEPSAS